MISFRAVKSYNKLSPISMKVQHIHQAPGDFNGPRHIPRAVQRSPGRLRGRRGRGCRSGYRGHQ